MGEVIRFPIERTRSPYTKPNPNSLGNSDYHTATDTVLDVFNEDDVFFRSVLSREVTSLTENAIRFVTRNQEYSIPYFGAPLYPGSYKEVASDQGKCFFSIQAGKVEIIANSSFPRFMVQNSEKYDGIGSNEEAAIYVRALDVFIGSMITIGNRSRSTMNRISRSFDPKYWRQESSLRAYEVVPYRFAGAVVNHHMEVKYGMDFDTKYDPPYDDHVAGLMNPLPWKTSLNADGTTMEFRDMLKKYSSIALQ